MYILSGKFVRAALYGFLVLLVVAVIPAGISTDDDGDENTPQIAWEMTLNSPCKEATRLAEAQEWLQYSSPGSRQRIVSVRNTNQQGSETDSIPLIVPLRT